MDKQTLELTKEWIKKAENDLRSAEHLITMENPPTDTICFHSEQCAEKYLKSFLIILVLECMSITGSKKKQKIVLTL